MAIESHGLRSSSQASPTGDPGRTQYAIFNSSLFDARTSVTDAHRYEHAYDRQNLENIQNERDLINSNELKTEEPQRLSYRFHSITTIGNENRQKISSNINVDVPKKLKSTKQTSDDQIDFLSTAVSVAIQEKGLSSYSYE